MARWCSTTYGRSTGFCIDPIEKKPLNHFYPGTSVLSFGTAGCNLGCKFCQNWDISKSREVERLSATASPEAIARTAAQHGCQRRLHLQRPGDLGRVRHRYRSRLPRRASRHVAVTAGYITPAARARLLRVHGRRQRRPQGLHRRVLQTDHLLAPSSPCSTRSSG